MFPLSYDNNTSKMRFCYYNLCPFEMTASLKSMQQDLGSLFFVVTDYGKSLSDDRRGFFLPDFDGLTCLHWWSIMNLWNCGPLSEAVKVHFEPVLPQTGWDGGDDLCHYVGVAVSYLPQPRLVLISGDWCLFQGDWCLFQGVTSAAIINLQAAHLLTCFLWQFGLFPGWHRWSWVMNSLLPGASVCHFTSSNSRKLG